MLHNTHSLSLILAIDLQNYAIGRYIKYIGFTWQKTYFRHLVSIAFRIDSFESRKGEGATKTFKYHDKMAICTDEIILQGWHLIANNYIPLHNFCA